MDIFFESPVPFIVIGAVLLTMAVIVYVQLRSMLALIGIAVVLLLTFAGVALEQVVVTERESVEAAVDGLLSDIADENLVGVLKRIDPQATAVVSDAETLMPLVKVDRANTAGDLAIEITDTTPPTATVRCRILIDAMHRNSGQRGAYLDFIDFVYIKRGDAWRLKEYSASEEWRGGAKSLRK